MLATAGSSRGAEPCGFTLDAGASGSPEDAGDALLDALDAVLEDEVDLDGCVDGFRVDLVGTFALTDTLYWDRPEPLTIAGPAVGAPARLEAVHADGPGTAVTHRLLTAEPAPALGPGPDPEVGPVTLERLVLTGGAVQTEVGDDLGGAVRADVVHLVDSELVDNRAAEGGAVHARVVHAERVSLVRNSATALAGTGGAIAASGSVTLVNVTLLDNVAPSGAGVALSDGATLDATFVTFLGNRASVAGADLHVADSPEPTVRLRGVLFGGVDEDSVADSCGGGGLPAAEAVDVDGSFAVDPSCPGVAVVSGPLTFTTVTFLAGTTPLPVVDGGPAAIGDVACDGDWPDDDQRGVGRPQGATCDAGAVERIVTGDVEETEEETAEEETEEGNGGEVAEDVVEEAAEEQAAGQPDGQPGGQPADRSSVPAEEPVGGPVPTSVPAGDGACADGCPTLSGR